MSVAATPFLQPVKPRSTVQDNVHLALREALMTGRFDPGQTLTIDALAQSFGVSHMPVREALRRLAAENALETTTTGSLRVPLVSRARLDDLVDARLALEPLATERAVPFLTGARLKALEAAVAAHAGVRPENGIEELLRRNQDVHFLVYRACGSQVFSALIEALWLRFGPYLRMLSQALAPRLGDPDFNNGARYHLALLEALHASDAKAARQAIEDDIRATADYLKPLVPTD